MVWAAWPDLARAAAASYMLTRGGGGGGCEGKRDCRMLTRGYDNHLLSSRVAMVARAKSGDLKTFDEMSKLERRGE